ncbi:YesL family protein [Bacillus haynesii]|uniref:YesL family protein n=1 Tax=Bacillus haynesii TaxID=1925021 RepID=UPI0022832D26|nr:YesL family protein [Bacillus haynesii]MCY7816129.1 YesL family protein [Bacillus haynesii]MCY8223073.1 YesL family protein [Bacillus haynesii]MCY8240845.1 YesL family protein [Bacillus haynesii]MCY8566750.1 YesL family protein [Bacillus haynesii]MCY8661149.1 YesL family protein [Bacillus haynesii]
MREKGVMAMMYGACEAIMKIAWLNGLWVLFTLGGGIVFGWAPSTAAMFTVVRKWLLGRTDAPVFKTFYQTYKKEFFKTNGLGLILITAGTILFVNYQFFRVRADLFSIMISYATLMVGLMYFVVFVYIFPLYVHVQLPFVRYFSQAALIGLVRPLTTAGMAAAGGLVVYVLLTVPGLIPFYGVSLFALVSMFIAHRCFLRLEG